MQATATASPLRLNKPIRVAFLVVESRFREINRSVRSADKLNGVLNCRMRRASFTERLCNWFVSFSSFINALQSFAQKTHQGEMQMGLMCFYWGLMNLWHETIDFVASMGDLFRLLINRVQWWKKKKDRCLVRNKLKSFLPALTLAWDCKPVLSFPVSTQSPFSDSLNTQRHSYVQDCFM